MPQERAAGDTVRVRQRLQQLEVIVGLADDQLRGFTSRLYGGEELAAILPHTDLEGAIQVAKNVCRAIAALRIPHSGNPEGGGFLTASVGVATALFRDGGTKQMAPALLQAADVALYKAKHCGRNRVESGLLITSVEEDCVAEIRESCS